MENETAPTEPLLLTIDEAARCLNVSRTTLYGLMRAEAFPTVRIGANRRIAYADLEAYVNSLRAVAAA